MYNKKNKINSKNIVFSAIQPTGQLTIGHYLGILNLWKILQFKYNCLYCIADLHSLTILNKNNIFNLNILDLVSFILASGINLFKCTIFLQSDIVEHLKLYWVLNCNTYLGELSRMTQFKDKFKINGICNLSLLSYPVLMASDILLYDSDYVCIGYDQIQHLELVRNLSIRFNKIYNNKFFNLPKPILNGIFSKIMSLLDINKKMSKSDLNKNNVIFLLDSPEIIKFKINKSITDLDYPPKIVFDLINKPGISNLLIILSGIKNVSIKFLEKYFLNYNYFDFKKVVYTQLSKFIILLQKKFFFIRKKEKFIKKILKLGKIKAKKIAKKKIINLYNLLKFK